jgi:hypothetical protein
VRNGNQRARNNGDGFQRSAKYLQTMLVEAAKIAPFWNPHLAALHERELNKGNRNLATLAVARRLVACTAGSKSLAATFLIFLA